MNNYYDVTAEEVCAVLTIQPILKQELPQLSFDDFLREKVIQVLNEAGYDFIDEPLANHYDARVKKEIRLTKPLMNHALFSSHLNVNQKAVVVILWCLLVLPRMDQMIRREIKSPLTITEEQLYENFKQHIGAKKNLRTILTILRKHQFIQYSSKMKSYIAGPRLFTAIDPITMYERVKTNMIHFLVNEQDGKQDEVSFTIHKYSQLFGEDEYDEERKNA